MAKKTNKWVQPLGNALSMATSFVAAVALGYFAGNYLDSRLGTAPYLMLILLLVGIATGFKIMYDHSFRTKMSMVSEDIEADEDLRDYKPSKEIIVALDEAKKMLSELDKADSKKSKSD